MTQAWHAHALLDVNAVHMSALFLKKGLCVMLNHSLTISLCHVSLPRGLPA